MESRKESSGVDSIKDNKDNQTQSLKSQTFVRFLKGGASGLLSGAMMQPLQVIKTSMQVSVQDAAKYLDGTKFAEELKASQNPVGDSLAEKQKNKKKMRLNLTFREATLLISRKEGPKGFMRGFVPSMMKNTLNAGTYFSMLYYTETLIRATGLFHDSQV